MVFLLLAIFMSVSVFPAQAGMILETVSGTVSDGSVPRASGDDPKINEIIDGINLCSPRKRG